MRVLPRPYCHAHERSTFVTPPRCPCERASYDLSFVSYNQLAMQIMLQYKLLRGSMAWTRKECVTARIILIGARRVLLLEASLE